MWKFLSSKNCFMFLKLVFQLQLILTSSKSPAFDDKTMKTILKVSEVYQGTWFNKALTQRFNLCNYFESYQLCNKLPCQTNIDRVQHNKNKVSEKVMLDLSKIFRIYTNFKFCVSCCPCHHHHHHHTEHQHFHWRNNYCVLQYVTYKKIS